MLRPLMGGSLRLRLSSRGVIFCSAQGRSHSQTSVATKPNIPGGNNVSAAAGGLSTTPSSPPPIASRALPVRHSRNQLPLVCQDPVQLRELTREVLEAPIGSLYAYRDAKNSLQDAWNSCQVTSQKVEYLIRGHAHGLEGTIWNRWVPPLLQPENGQQLVEPDDSLQSIESLLQRLQSEGYTYMKLRADRLQELDGTADVLLDAKETVLRQLKQQGMDLEQPPDTTQTLLSLEKSAALQDVQQEVDEFAKKLASGSEDSRRDESLAYMNDFALPGPTVHMFDCFLDAMACSVLTQKQHELASPLTAWNTLLNILGRNSLDRGSKNNSNPHTRPTILSMNAAIRVAANMPYDRSIKTPSNIKLRDDAMQCAFGAFHAISSDDTVFLERNSATYTYLLNLVAKYFYPSITRGNVAHGMFHHARLQGLIDERVVQAYLAANEPSNGPQFDAFIGENDLRNKPAWELPIRWRRYYKVRRFHPREATY